MNKDEYLLLADYASYVDCQERVSEAFKNLDPESIYTRFFYHKRMLTALGISCPDPLAADIG